MFKVIDENTRIILTPESIYFFKVINRNTRNMFEYIGTGIQFNYKQYYKKPKHCSWME